MAANVYDLPADFPERLRSLREARYLTQGDLAGRSGLAARSIHELESGRRKRALAKTVMLIAEALDVSVADLINGVDTPVDGVGDLSTEEAVAGGTPGDARLVRPPRFRRIARIVVPAVLLALAFGVGLLLRGPDDAGVVGVDEQTGVLSMRDPRSGRLLWSRRFPDRILACRPSPAEAGVILVGLGAETHEGGRLVAVHAEDGRDLWSVSPDPELAEADFGLDAVSGGGFSCLEILPADLDGDGVREVVAYFRHSRWFPGAVCVVSAGGALESTYFNRGHLYGIVAADIDADGRDELVCAGTNNAPAYNGPTVFLLDVDHRTGAAVDLDTSPGCAVEDSSLVRIVIPNLPADAVARIQPGGRAQAQRPGTHLVDDGVGLRVDVGFPEAGMYVLTLDSELRPLSLGLSDALRANYAAAGVDDASWRTAWVNAHVRFENGTPVSSSAMP